MEEHVVAVRGDESESSVVYQTFDGALWHSEFPFLPTEGGAATQHYNDPGQRWDRLAGHFKIDEPSNGRLPNTRPKEESFDGPEGVVALRGLSI